jgi:hypothetical protein
MQWKNQARAQEPLDTISPLFPNQWNPLLSWLLDIWELPWGSFPSTAPLVSARPLGLLKLALEERQQAWQHTLPGEKSKELSELRMFEMVS